jgi:divalent metal cation (Fe/Co/Zn/Cd) transporter
MGFGGSARELLITIAILGIVWQAGRRACPPVGWRRSGMIGGQAHVVDHVQEVDDVTDVRAGWDIGCTPSNLAVSPSPLVEHAVAVEVRHRLLHHLPYLSNVTVHVDPSDQSGEGHHGIVEHTHEDLAAHSHP